MPHLPISFVSKFSWPLHSKVKNTVVINMDNCLIIFVSDLIAPNGSGLAKWRYSMILQLGKCRLLKNVRLSLQQSILLKTYRPLTAADQGTSDQYMFFSRHFAKPPCWLQAANLSTQFRLMIDFFFLLFCFVSENILSNRKEQYLQ